MRIDLNAASMPELERSQGSSGAETRTDASVQGNGRSDDVAKLATGNDAIATLKTKLEDVPDVRQQRVDSLRQAITSGGYTISPDGIADKMLAEADRSQA